MPSIPRFSLAHPSQIQLQVVAPLDYIELMALYVEHAQMAATCQRHRAAHGLFQTALSFYDHACTLAATSDDLPPVESLAQARQRLDEGARVVYESDSQPFVFSEELLSDKQKLLC